MLAAELASTFTDLFSKVVLLAPAGLWNEDHPWTLDFMSAPFEALPGLLFADPQAPRARAMFAPPEDAAQGLEQAVNAIWTLGCVAKFLWPIPDRGLVKRLNRVTAPTLVVWGEDDQLIPVAFAHEYGRRIAGSQIKILPNCGHIPQVEHMETTLKLARDFLA
jgi:pimeloyl-ACP methyl ester carboxylesterase